MDAKDIVSVWDRDGREHRVTYSRSLTLLGRPGYTDAAPDAPASAFRSWQPPPTDEA